MRILITGARGFIGRHLTGQLKASGHDVLGCDREDGDLRQQEVATMIIKKADPEVVIHLAARVGRLFGEDDVEATIKDNVTMTSSVARAAAAAGARLVYASTSEVYGDRNQRRCSESSALDVLPHNIYGLSKRWGEEVCQLYAPDDLTVWRISMPYGPGLPAGRGRAAIINFLDQARRRIEMPVHRGSERSWCWVGDTVRAMEMTLSRPGSVWNIGRDDDPRPMREVARLACQLAGAPESLIVEVDPPERQTVVKRLATTRIRSLGWEPRVSLETGMIRTLRWMESA